MKRKVKIYQLFGYSMIPARYGSNANKGEFFFGQFSNLMKAYKVLSGSGLQSYSLIAKRIKQEAIYSAYDLKVLISNKKFSSQRITIKVAYLNDLSFINQPDLLRKEILKEFYYLDYGKDFSKGRFYINKGKVERLDRPYGSGA
jgi:hypothetical protein